MRSTRETSMNTDGGMITDSDSDSMSDAWSTLALTLAHDFHTTVRCLPDL